MLVDLNGDKIGKLQDVYVDVGTDEPQFATVKDGFVIGRHLTFVPLGGVQVRPDELQVTGTKEQVRSALTSRSTARSFPRKTSRRCITTSSRATRLPPPRADVASPSGNTAEGLAARHLLSAGAQARSRTREGAAAAPMPLPLVRIPVASDRSSRDMRSSEPGFPPEPDAALVNAQPLSARTLFGGTHRELHDQDGEFLPRHQGSKQPLFGSSVRYAFSAGTTR